MTSAASITCGAAGPISENSTGGRGRSSTSCWKKAGMKSSMSLRKWSGNCPPHEVRPYLYTALNVQTHFRHLSAKHQPDALDPEKVDDYFVEDLCRLNADERYFRGADRADAETLHPYLRRYLILYFDHAVVRGSARQAFVEDFISRHRFHRPSRKQAPLSQGEREACRRLNVTFEEFAGMDRKALIRCYRRQAMTDHPDTGGDEEAFVRLTEAFECLLRRKQ